jgi:hypothetical protein
MTDALVRPCGKCGGVEKTPTGVCIPCRRQYSKDYRVSHREEMNEVKRNYRHTHRKEISDYGKKYHAEHKDEQTYKDKQKKHKKEYYVAHQDELKRYSKEYQKSCRALGLCVKGCGKPVAPGCLSLCVEHVIDGKNRNYLNEYGITRAEASLRLLGQDGRCAICGIPITVAEGLEKFSISEYACVDHVKSTGKIRGILCHLCNVAIGQDESSRLLGMIQYLLKDRPVEEFPRKGSFYENKKRREIRLRWLDAQGGKCDICQVVLPLVHKIYVSLDHDHKTGLVRGVLCRLCNNTLGFLKDDLVIIQRAIDYLAKTADPEPQSNV